ncbi:tumor necrosis factor ligand superfamily member 8 [Bombina bombina]|uniref:tumor necrosis factor ligand superfamily member 8 n=1 Tax=Bombina bombina TaxID=8345 RepID=UPI00235ACCED|nr:tumor necrosis factor ligand superfamily member 8 [Bombina bombina]
MITTVWFTELVSTSLNSRSQRRNPVYKLDNVGASFIKHDPNVKWGNWTQSHYRTVTAQLRLSIKQRSNSSTVLWNKDGILKGIDYENGNFTIQTQGLYFVYCHLHFNINNCSDEDQDLWTKLNVNGKEKYQVLYTVAKQQDCNIRHKNFRDQHLNLQINLQVSDNVSVETSHIHYLNRNYLAQSNLFGAFLL